MTKEYFSISLGTILHGDSREHLKTSVPDNSLDLIFTSPPFGLITEKEYGNVESSRYVDWFYPFAEHFYRVLKDSGSLVIDIGGAWNKGEPTKSLYNFELLISLCREHGFYLAQDFYWWNPSKLPSPIEWVNIRRNRVKDSVNTVWWLSKTPYPKANNRRVLKPYSDSQIDLFDNGYKPKNRPSGHDISETFSNKNRGAIPPNLIAAPNTKSNSYYFNYCKDNNIDPHPARIPSVVPEFFIMMCTDEDDKVLDPFAGSCVTGEVCQRSGRRWVCVDTEEQYLQGAKGRFIDRDLNDSENAYGDGEEPPTYKAFRPGFGWNTFDYDRLDENGGRSR